MSNAGVRECLLRFYDLQCLFFEFIDPRYTYDDLPPPISRFPLVSRIESVYLKCISMVPRYNPNLIEAKSISDCHQYASNFLSIDRLTIPIIYHWRLIRDSLNFYVNLSVARF